MISYKTLITRTSEIIYSLVVSSLVDNLGG
jgi:hypothetical protein